MGSFYTNITVRGPRREDVAETLRAGERAAILSPTAEGVTVVYDAEAESQDDTVVSLAKRLSAEHHCVAWALLNHDDDLLRYWLFDGGELVDEYDSSPGYFTGEGGGPSVGDARKLCAAFGAVDAAEPVEDVLRYNRAVEDQQSGRYVFETERHLDLCKALRLPLFAVGTGYDYLMQGEAPEGMELDDCLIIDG